MKIKIRPEICISMCNYATVKEWKRSVAWFLSFGAESVADAERNFSRKRDVFTLLRSPYTIVLRKIDTCSCKKAAWKSLKTLGKDSGCESRAYIVSIGRKTTVYRQEAGEIVFFGNAYHDVHSNAFLYFADLPVSSSLYHLYSSRAGLHNSVWYSASLL